MIHIYEYLCVLNLLAGLLCWLYTRAGAPKLGNRVISAVVSLLVWMKPFWWRMYVEVGLKHHIIRGLYGAHGIGPFNKIDKDQAGKSKGDSLSSAHVFGPC